MMMTMMMMMIMMMMFRETWRTASRDSMFWAARKAYGPDQGFLKRYVWPWAKWSAVSHDAYFCRQFPRSVRIKECLSLKQINFNLL